MINDKQPLMSAIDDLCCKHKSDPECFSSHGLKDLESLIRSTNWLLGKSYRGNINGERHWQTIGNARRLHEKLEKEWSDYQREKKWRQDYLCQQEEKYRSTKEEDRPTTHYIWRTRRDGKVRPEHAANDGKIFAWDNPPPTGNPGEALGCRCRAEPYKAEREDAGELQERRSQVVTYAAPDNTPAWTREDFARHYFLGNGRPVTLDEIGHLKDVIDCARTRNQVAAGGGAIFDRVANQIIEAARQKGEGSFSDSFYRGYEFQDFVWSLGGATVAGMFLANVIEKGDFLIVTADIEYTFTDMFTNPFDLPEGKSEYKGWDLPFSTPYPVVGTWSTHLEAIIRK